MSVPDGGFDGSFVWNFPLRSTWKVRIFLAQQKKTQ